MRHWLSFKEMVNAINENSTAYYKALITDYNSFLATQTKPFSIDSFIRYYWNIIILEDFVDLKPGTKVYGPYSDRLIEQEILNVSTFDFDENTFICPVLELGSKIEWTAKPGFLYRDIEPFDGFNVKKEETKWKTILITKTNPPQN